MAITFTWLSLIALLGALWTPLAWYWVTLPAVLALLVHPRTPWAGILLGMLTTQR